MHLLNPLSVLMSQEELKQCLHSHLSLHELLSLSGLCCWRDYPVLGLSCETRCLFSKWPQIVSLIVLQDLLIQLLLRCLNKELPLHIKSGDRHSVTSLKRSPLISVAFEKPIWSHLIINEQKSFCCNATLPSELHLIHHLWSRAGQRRPCSHLHHFSSLQGTEK